MRHRVTFGRSGRATTDVSSRPAAYWDTHDPDRATLEAWDGFDEMDTPEYAALQAEVLALAQAPLVVDGSVRHRFTLG